VTTFYEAIKVFQSADILVFWDVSQLCIIKFDGIEKTQNWDGKVKSFRCKARKS